MQNHQDAGGKKHVYIHGSIEIVIVVKNFLSWGL